MDTSLIRYAARVIATWALVAGTATAGQTSRTNNGNPASVLERVDWLGAWVIPREAFVDEIPRLRDPKDPVAPLLTADHAAMQGSRSRSVRSNSETCRPTGMPNVMRYPFAIEFLFSPGRVTMLLEYDSTIRRIYTDGRSPTDDPDPSYTGESRGHWERDTLVVHTTAITSSAELLPAVRTSGRASITERIHLKDANHLEIDTTVEDPVALRAPWRYSRTYERSNAGFFEHVCLDNNRDVLGDRPT